MELLVMELLKEELLVMELLKEELLGQIVPQCGACLMCRGRSFHSGDLSDVQGQIVPQCGACLMCRGRSFHSVGPILPSSWFLQSARCTHLVSPAPHLKLTSFDPQYIHPLTLTCSLPDCLVCTAKVSEELERTLKEYPGTEVQTGTRSSERGDEEQDRPGRWLDVAGGAAGVLPDQKVASKSQQTSPPFFSKTRVTLLKDCCGFTCSIMQQPDCTHLAD
ncbi:hypothetical protein F7725_003945 [Dissostichus mawsoni]|uniref:Uncharacterized protein n=1 Tax=Dissostichus mawsoni TaxID=36200 RepID=A0A7J5YE93_DISMA|nr:hypothetical protein F7725_003945 [Dissostichus mawsoni]